MSTPNTLKIRKIINDAKQQDAINSVLIDFAASKVTLLHHTIKLPSENTAGVLSCFITRYIEHVPDFLDALTALMLEANIYEQGSVFLTIAEEFFIAPPEIVNEHTGLVALLDEAYLSHRMIEEVSDRILLACGAPLSPMDMNTSNIVVHSLLGEEFANQLDLAVHYAIEALFDKNGLLSAPTCSRYIHKHQENCWKDVLDRWPCLAGDASISLDMDSWLS
ncbi:MAG: hypothetical protein U5M23_16245 [Marinagarivorans sp.]|nr:hypothetical protein [Marinagarivorans sp.]